MKTKRAPETFGDFRRPAVVLALKMDAATSATKSRNANLALSFIGLNWQWGKSGYSKTGMMEIVCNAYREYLPHLTMSGIRRMLEELTRIRAERDLERRKRIDGKFINKALLAHKRSVLDEWAFRVWQAKGCPHFKKQIITGIRYGKPITHDNGRTGWDRVVLERYVGVRRIRDIATGRVSLWLGIED